MSYEEKIAGNIDGRTTGDGIDDSVSCPSSRHDGWTPEIRVKFLEALANCGNISTAATFVQRSRTSAYNLKQRDENFSRGWDAALLLARDVATDFLQERAINGIEEDVYHQGEVIGTRRRYDSRLLLAHIARLDKLAERVSVSRGAARFDEMIHAIAAEEDTAALISEPTTDEIAGIIAEVEAEATIRQVEGACLRRQNDAADGKMDGHDSPSSEPDPLAMAEARNGPMHEVDWGDGKELEYWRMLPEDAAKICSQHPQVKTRQVAMDDPAFMAAVVMPGAQRIAGIEEADPKSA